MHSVQLRAEAARFWIIFAKVQLAHEFVLRELLRQANQLFLVFVTQVPQGVLHLLLHTTAFFWIHRSPPP